MSVFLRFPFGPLFSALFTSVFASFRSHAALQLEILARRHQLGILQRSVKRPKLTPAGPQEICGLLRTMSRENPLWGAPRMHSELGKLGLEIGETSVSKYMGRHRKPPSQTWRTFLDNHVQSMVSMDFLPC